MKKTLLALAMIVLFSSSALAAPKDWSDNEWYQFFEQAVTTSLGEAPGAAAQTFGGVAAAPIMDVYSALSGIAGASKTALTMWLQQKRITAELNNQTAKGDLYQAYETALTTGDNSRLKALLEEYDAKRRGGSPAAGARQLNLNGMWQTNVNGQVRQIRIVHSGNEVKAIKLTNSIYVPAGRTTWYGTMNSNPFDGLGQYAQENYTNPQWAPVKIRVIDNNTISVQALDSNYDSQNLKRMK